MGKFVDLMGYPRLLNIPSLPIALDTETLGATRETNIPIYFSTAAKDFGANAGPTTTQNGFDYLCSVCACNRPKVFQNLKFDVWVLWREGIEVKGPFEDTILMHCLLDEHHLGFHKLKVMSRELLERPRLDELRLHEAQRKVKNNWQLPQQILHDYSLPDAVDTLDLYYLFKPQLEEQNLWGLYRMTVAAELVYLKMFKRGVRLDTENLEKALTRVLQVLKKIAKKLWEVFDEEFKISSPKQVGNVLAKHFPLRIKTKAGDWCTDKDALEPFRGDSKMQLLLAWKFLDKARQYLQGYKKRERGGRLYADYRQTTVTGRSKCSNPNLENIPKQRGRISEVEVGDAELAKDCAEAFRQVRACIAPSEGARLMACDYKQIEYRCFAFYSGSERLISALERGVDFHTFTCEAVFGEETPQRRYMIKIVSYGLLFGMGGELLKTRLKIYHPNPGEVLAQYEQMFPEMRELQSRLRRIAASRGYLIDVFGRRYRYLPERPHAVVAWLIQGTAANIKKSAMVKTDPILEGRRSGLALEIHDELVFDMFPEDAHLAKDIHEAMEDFPQLGRIPVLSDIAVGPNLLELRDVELDDAIGYLTEP
ncbi:hypothetical protein LCGC14_0613010 [marine sediment metagenome]|uniref:DNA-directed DNA polymerase family A palm domain-containing protein n=1 Tax=marine sediment metagenome TaxID=412755 RepID=A0A0F9RBW0_9ZZZZ